MFTSGRTTSCVVLFGGTFDPPHAGHLLLPLDVLARIRAIYRDAALIYVPAARSPHKREGPAAGDAERIEMLRLALHDAAASDRAVVWTDEIDRARAAPGEPSFSIDTARRARRWLDANGMVRTALRWLIGADQAVAFHRWRDYRALLSIAEPLVMCRDAGFAGADALIDSMRRSGAWSEAELEAWRGRVVSTRSVDAASSGVRRWLIDAAANRANLAAALSPSVLRYIEQAGLYRSDKA